MRRYAQDHRHMFKMQNQRLVNFVEQASWPVSAVFGILLDHSCNEYT